MSEDEGKSTLSESQRLELWELRKQYQDSIGFDVSDPDIWFGNNITGYLDMLMIEAAIGHRQEKRALTQLRKAAKFRKDSMRAFQSYLKRKPTAEDIIQELSRIVSIPDYIADFIYHDFEQLQK